MAFSSTRKQRKSMRSMDKTFCSVLPRKSLIKSSRSLSFVCVILISRSPGVWRRKISRPVNDQCHGFREIVPEDRHSFGLVRHFSRFVKEFSKLALPLARLTWRNDKFSWIPTCKKSFQELKGCLTMSSEVAIPTRTTRFVFYCDAN